MEARPVKDQEVLALITPWLEKPEHVGIGTSWKRVRGDKFEEAMAALFMLGFSGDPAPAKPYRIGQRMTSYDVVIRIPAEIHKRSHFTTTTVLARRVLISGTIIRTISVKNVVDTLHYMKNRRKDE